MSKKPDQQIGTVEWPTLRVTFHHVLGLFVAVGACSLVVMRHALLWPLRAKPQEKDGVLQ
jgi:hypothetical protein